MVAEQPVSTATWQLRRQSVPLAALGAMALVWLVLWALPADSFDRGMRGTFGFIAAVIAAVVIAIWFFALSGMPGRVRALVGVALAAALLFFVGSLRNVEFSGDMEPTFDFRWRPSREARLQAYLDSETPAPAPAAGEVPASDAANGAVAAGDAHSAETSAALSATPVPTSADSPRYRGVNYDGVVVGPKLSRDWVKQPPKCLWRHPCGGGYAAFSVVGDLAVTIEQRGPDEVVVCYDVGTGRHRWTHAYPALFSERLGGDGPRATPTIQDGHVYSLGATGDLVKLELATGKLEWQVNILAENGSGNLDWGMSGSPLVYDGRVVVNPGAQQGTETSADVVAVDDRDGKVLFRGGKAKSSYCSPMLVDLLGTRQLLIFDAAGLAGFAVDDGRELWRVPWTSDFDINAAQPVVLDDRQIVISSQAGCALIQLALAEGNWVATQVWRQRQMKCSYANPLVYQGHLYGLDEGIMACVDLQSGKRLWKDRAGQYGHGQMLLAGDLLVVLSEKGELALVEANPEKFHELGRIQAIDGKTWNNPVLVRGRAIIRNHLEMACYELPVEE